MKAIARWAAELTERIWWWEWWRMGHIVWPVRLTLTSSSGVSPDITIIWQISGKDWKQWNVLDSDNEFLFSSHKLSKLCAGNAEAIDAVHLSRVERYRLSWWNCVISVGWWKVTESIMKLSSPTLFKSNRLSNWLCWIKVTLKLSISLWGYEPRDSCHSKYREVCFIEQCWLLTFRVTYGGTTVLMSQIVMLLQQMKDVVCRQFSLQKHWRLNARAHGWMSRQHTMQSQSDTDIAISDSSNAPVDWKRISCVI